MYAYNYYRLNGANATPYVNGLFLLLHVPFMFRYFELKLHKILLLFDCDGDLKFISGPVPIFERPGCF